MRIAFAAALAAGLMVGACGGGQTDKTESEEALFGNGVEPTAPSPGTVDQPTNGAAGAPENTSGQ
jgi:hypothetical protein